MDQDAVKLIRKSVAMMQCVKSKEYTIKVIGSIKFIKITRRCILKMAGNALD
jgi:hypothetical protein